MLPSPLISVEIPDNVLNNPWLKGIFGQIYLHQPSSIANTWLARAAHTARGKKLSTVHATGFTVQILKDVGLSRCTQRFGNHSRQNTRQCFRELVECVADPTADLDTLERIERTVSALALHQSPEEDNVFFLLAMKAAVEDAVEIRKTPPAVHRFGMTVRHTLEVTARRKLFMQFPRPAHGYAEEAFLELEREAACGLLAEKLVGQLRLAPTVNPG